MTNGMNFIPIVFDRHAFVSGHTLLYYGLLLGTAITIIYGYIRLRMAAKVPGLKLPRRLMLGTSAVVLAIGFMELYLTMSDWLMIEGLGVPQSHPAVFRSSLCLVVAKQLQMLCLPVFFSAIAFCLALAMTPRGGDRL